MSTKLLRTQAPHIFGAGLLLLGLAGINHEAHSAPVTFNFAGQVTQTVFDPFDPLSGAVQVGTPMYSYMNFDTSASDLNPAADVGSYAWTGGTYGFAAVLGSVLFPVMHSLSISVVDGAPGGIDQYLVHAWEGTQAGLNDYFSISLTLQDDTGTAFSSDALPSTRPDLGKFALRSFVLTGQYTDLNSNFIQYEVQGNLVPEPATLALTGLGLLGCAGFSRRGKKLP
ncbi:PEP-CTERM sorting domain-containing protein [Roseateles oligotrophus]|uniref:PEP-CTERM sorting domain-containing protein n=1 Tax=Roseateles oligotrophus TaxID=1769250 RepID=A0ABT2YMV3_9BURK|nr:PEP-CTERM sorting domain-containing protein [Roseateles oligotrophus]MCV2371337.1 PEP-CTERM sorting domain-containing protein [Roseateles oligotrophus]